MGRSRNLEGVPLVSAKADEKKDGGGDGSSTNDDGGGGDDRGTGSAVTLEQVQSVAEDVATRVVERLLADDPTDDNDGGTGSGGSDGGNGGTPTTSAGVERSVAAEVRAELERIRETEQLGERVAKVEAAVVEKPPVKLGRFTRAMWGGDE